MQELKDQKQLIVKLIKGDAYSFDAVFKHYNKRVYGFSFSNLKNREDAEGVVQEVFLQLWKDRRKLKNVNSLDAWIFSISFNVIRKRFRKLARENKHLEILATEMKSRDHVAITDTEYNDLLERAEKIIEKMPPRQKKVFLLSNKEGLSNSDISRLLRITNKTVENHLTRAKTFLRKTLADDFILTVAFFWLIVK